MACRQVSQKTGAQVRVLSELGEPGCKTSVCLVLQGSKEEVLLAHCILENLVLECSPQTETLEVPQTAFGRIIGTFDGIVSLHFHALWWNSVFGSLIAILILILHLPSTFT